jgi:hypothetical protein
VDALLDVMRAKESHVDEINAAEAVSEDDEVPWGCMELFMCECSPYC